MTRLLATGDWHIDAHPDYGRETGDRLRDQRQTVEKIVDLAIEHDVDGLLLAGDLWHARQPSSAARLAVWEPLRRLRVEHPRCDILAIPGNHCVEAAALDSAIALEHFSDILDVRRDPGVWHGAGCAVATLPWVPISRRVAALNGADRDATYLEVAQLLIRAATGLREQMPDDVPSLLMTHFSISGAVTPTGLDIGPDFGVVLPVEELEALGFDAVIAGHIHRQQVLCDDPFIAYVGSPAPVDFAEATTDHGCLLLDFDSGCLTTDYLRIESRPFVTLDYDLADEFDAQTLTSARGFVSDSVVDAVVRLRYTGSEEQARRIDHAALSRELYACGAHKVYAIQAEIERPDRARVAGVDEDLAPLSALDLWIAAEGLDGWQRDSLRELGARYIEAVGA